MKKYLLSLAVVLAGITLLASCDDNDGSSYQYVTYSNGAYVVNAGNMGGSIDGTLTYIDYTTNTAYQKVFQSANNGQSLGNTANDGLVYGDKIYVVVDKENTIEVLDRVTRKRIKQISTTAMLGLKEGTSPRRIIAGGNSIFFTTYGGVVARVDTLAFNLQNKYTVGSYPEGLMGAGNYLYVANSDYGNGNGTISIVDLASGSVNTLKVEGVNNPKEFFLTQSNLYVLDMGTYDANWNQTGCGIYRMNGNSSATLVAEATMAAQYGEKFYLINNAYGTVTEPVYSVYDTSSGSLTALNLSEKVESPADIKVDPVTGHIFVLSYQMGDYGYADYNANGYAVEYDAQGNKLRRYDTGVGPTTMFFDAGIRTEEVK